MIAPSPPAAAPSVAAVRAFNRFYTDVIGVLGEGLLRTPYSLTEARVLYELAQRDATPAVDLRRAIHIDAGYLSRILSRFERDGLIRSERAASDRRRQLIYLTAEGAAAFDVLDQRSSQEVSDLLSGLSADDRRELMAAMQRIQRLLRSSRRARSVGLRAPGPGELGWVVQRHGALYAQEYGWDERFEGLVARIVADFAAGRDAGRERAWIAELDGEPVGSVFCVRETETTAKLRLLLVEPHARGLGIGSRLVQECLSFARTAGYADITLWTNSVLHAARRIYERAGFELQDSAAHDGFGHELVGQNWRRLL